MNAFQLMILLLIGGDYVIGEEEIVRRTGLWSDERSLMFINCVWRVGSLIRAMSRISGWWPENAEKNVGVSGTSSYNELAIENRV